MSPIEEDSQAEHSGKVGQRRSGMRRTWLTRLVDLLLPPLCLHCRRPVGEHGGLCPRCWPRISFITHPLCDVTGLPLPFDSGGRQVSPRALAEPHAFARARAVAPYDEVLRSLVHAFKYADRREALPLFGNWLALAGAELLADAELIVPVPLYRTRLWQRRFNQSALLAVALAKRSGVPVDVAALKRRRATQSQVGLSPDQRRRNVAGAFFVAPRRRPSIEDRRILLVDDVYTTGATLNACARALNRAGAQRVDVLVLARAIGPGPHADARSGALPSAGEAAIR